MFTLDDARPFHKGESEVSRAKRNVKAYLIHHLGENQAFAPLSEQSVITHYSDRKAHHRWYDPEVVRAAISQLESEGIILRDGEYLKHGANWEAVYRQRRHTMDSKYDGTNISSTYKPIFDQLVSEFPEYEVWVREEDFGRFLSAGIVNPTPNKNNAVTVALVKGYHNRTHLLTHEELARIREHLELETGEDLSI